MPFLHYEVTGRSKIHGLQKYHYASQFKVSFSVPIANTEVEYSVIYKGEDIKVTHTYTTTNLQNQVISFLSGLHHHCPHTSSWLLQEATMPQNKKKRVILGSYFSYNINLLFPYYRKKVYRWRASEQKAGLKFKM